VLLLWGGMFLAGGCGQIRLNNAMERLNDRYVELFYDIETAPREDIREQVRLLVEALADPSITSHSDDEEYQRLLEETNQAAGRIYTQARDPERESLLALRSRLRASCQACHDRYRR